jgi:hypothetical protein
MKHRCSSGVLCVLVLLVVGTTIVRGEQVYFPANTFDPILQRWFSAELHLLEEPSLLKPSAASPAETYRFLWLRTFNQPIAVRLDVSADRTGVLTTKIANGEAGFPYTSKKLTMNVRGTLSREQVQRFLQRFNDVQFWSLPTTVNDPIGTDGSEWIFEATNAGKYHIVERWCADSTPNKRAIHDLGVMLAIDLAGLNIPSKDIY